MFRLSKHYPIYERSQKIIAKYLELVKTQSKNKINQNKKANIVATKKPKYIEQCLKLVEDKIFTEADLDNETKTMMSGVSLSTYCPLSTKSTFLNLGF